jgi:heme-degrading monooxygenase HmoA
MVTVITKLRVRDGREAEWDEVFGKRAAAAREQKGFEFVQLCRPNGSPRDRVIVGTWQTYEDWASWHDDPEFERTRAELEDVEAGSGESQWYEVVVEERG